MAQRRSRDLELDDVLRLSNSPAGVPEPALIQEFANPSRITDAQRNLRAGSRSGRRETTRDER